MMLDVAHKKSEVYDLCRHMAMECYQITKLLPADEHYSMVRQIKRAATSVLLNLVEGASRKSSADRRRFYEVARGSLVELDAAIHFCVDMKFIKEKELYRLTPLVQSIFRILSKMISRLSN